MAAAMSGNETRVQNIENARNADAQVRNMLSEGTMYSEVERRKIEELAPEFRVRPHSM